MPRERAPPTPGRHLNTTAREPLQETSQPPQGQPIVRNTTSKPSVMSGPDSHAHGGLAKDKNVVDLTDSPQFGQASPIRNPLHKIIRKAEDKLFNHPKPGHARPEH